MDIGRFFSRKDFFNYYVAGVIWLIDFAILITIFSSQLDLRASLSSVSGLPEAIVVGALAIVVPYAVGFALNPLGDLLTDVLHMMFGDPTKWVTDYSQNRYKGHRIPKPLGERINQLASQTFNGKLENEGLWFYYLRTFVEQEGGAASELAMRALDLANLTESLLLPMPLLVALSVVKMIGNLNIALPLSNAIFVLIFTLLAIRYMKLREYWVKHIYRAFLVLKT
jgi:hypothetical protein